MKSKILLIALISLALAACGNRQKKEVVGDDVVTQFKFTALKCNDVPVLTPVKLLPVEWKILAEPDKPVLYTLTSAGYVSLSKNVADIKAALAEKGSVATYYRGCIDSYNASGEAKQSLMEAIDKSNQ